MTISSAIILALSCSTIAFFTGVILAGSKDEPLQTTPKNEKDTEK